MRSDIETVRINSSLERSNEYIFRHNWERISLAATCEMRSVLIWSEQNYGILRREGSCDCLSLLDILH
jgi:hypothetical protein